MTAFMGEREFVIYLDAARRNRYRHRHKWDGKHVVEFRIQYEAWIEGEWHAVVRYDSAHAKPHRDLLHAGGSTTKSFFEGYSNAEVLTLGQRDVMENWEAYRRVFERELKG